MITMTYLDNGFYVVSRADAVTLTGGHLPGAGRECMVSYDGNNYWLTQTPHHGKFVWSMRLAIGWRLVGGIAVL